MGRAVLLVILAGAGLPALSGCGTYWNVGPALVQGPGPEKEQGCGIIYGATRGWCAQKRSDSDVVDPLSAEPDLSEPAKPLRGCLYYLDRSLYYIDRSFYLIDPPLCVVADTLTLPYTIYYTLRCRALRREADRQATVSDGSPESAKEAVAAPPDR